MIVESQHVIGTQSIQLGITRERDGRAWMDRASALWRSILAAIADEVFSRYCSPTERIRLERVELDLGTIGPDDFDAELPERFRAALEAALRRQISAALHERRRLGMSAETSVLETLEYVLLHGYVPWWASVDAGYDPVEILVALLRREPQRIAALARKIGRFRRVRSRLVYWLADPEIVVLIRAIAGGDAEFVLAYAADLQARHEEAPIVAATRQEFRHAKWEVILAHLLADRGSRFNTKAFLRQTLHDLAAHFRVEYGELLAELAHVARISGIVWREASLPQLLTELHVEQVVARYRDLMEFSHDGAAESSRAGSPDPAAADAGFEGRLKEIREFDSRRRDREIPPYIRTQAATHDGVVDTGVAGGGAQGLGPRHPTSEAGSGTSSEGRGLLAPPGAAPEGQSFAEIDSAMMQRALRAMAVFEGASAVWQEILRDGSRPPSPEQERALQTWQALSPALRHIAIALKSSGVPSGPELVASHDRDSAATRALVPARAAATSPATDAAVARTEDLDLMPVLRRLLETGTLPASVTNRFPSAHAEAWLAFILVQHDATVPPLLRAWSRAGRLTVALPQHFADDTLQLVVEVVEPVHAEEIGVFVRTARRGDPPLLGANPKSEAFRRATWTVVFDYLLSDRGSVFNTRSFLEYSIDRLAARQRLEADAVLEYLLAASREEGRHALFHDLRAIAEKRLAARGGLDAVKAASMGESVEAPIRNEAVSSAVSSGMADPGSLAFVPNDTAAAELRGGKRSASRIGASIAPDLPTADPLQEFRRDRLHSSSLAALRLLNLVIVEAPLTRTSAIAAALPVMWQRLADARMHGGVRLLLQRTELSLRAMEGLLDAGATPLLEALLFAGEPGSLAVWRDTLAWCEAHRSLVGIGSERFDPFRAKLWQALLREWRRNGGRPIRDIGAWLARLLPAFGTSFEDETARMLRVRSEAGLRERGQTDIAQHGDARNSTSSIADGASTLAADESDEAPAAVVNEPIAITNAGLVLLAPFFPELHRRGGLLKDGLFRDFRANQEAVHLLQFIAAGEGRTREHSLVLNKILCGLDPACAVVPEVELAAPARDAATALLDNAVKQWPRGAVISVEGLRGTYLLRSGRLKRIEKGAWSLKVESKGWDILLADLPWSFGRVHPAWMPAPVIVDWI